MLYFDIYATPVLYMLRFDICIIFIMKRCTLSILCQIVFRYYGGYDGALLCCRFVSLQHKGLSGWCLYKNHPGYI